MNVSMWPALDSSVCFPNKVLDHDNHFIMASASTMAAPSTQALVSLIDGNVDLLSQVFRLRVLHAGTICRERFLRPGWTWPSGVRGWRRPARWRRGRFAARGYRDGYGTWRFPDPSHASAM